MNYKYCIKKDPATIQTVKEKRKIGWSKHAIAVTLGVSTKTVNTICKEQNIN